MDTANLPMLRLPSFSHLCGEFWRCLGQAIDQHRQQGLERAEAMGWLARHAARSENDLHSRWGFDIYVTSKEDNHVHMYV